MTGRSLVHRFWVNFDGSYRELVETFEQAFELRFYFMEPLENVNAADVINYGDCNISIKSLKTSPKAVDCYPNMWWNGIERPKDAPNYAIDFNSYVILDTPKTRRQLQVVAQSIPGGEAILTLDNRWVVGARSGSEWVFCENDLLPDVARYKPKDTSSLLTEKLVLNDLVEKFIWEKRSMFDHFLHYPFDKAAGMPFDRVDWRITTTASYDEIASQITKFIRSKWGYSCGFYSDFEEEYCFVRYETEEYWTDFVIQPSTNFNIEGYRLTKPGTLLISARTDFYGDLYIDTIINGEISEMVSSLNLPTDLFRNLYIDGQAPVVKGGLRNGKV